MYYSVVNDVYCIYLICNKKISCAGQEKSVGRPGNRPSSSREAARNSETCLGPYAIRTIVHPHHMGHSTRDGTQASSRRPRGEDYDITNQPIASTSKRSAAEDHGSPATAVLHLRRPPYFFGGVDDDVHVWTSIVSRWLNTVQGEPSKQMTNVVSPLRGAVFECYTALETRTRCPGD